ncbi:hypothetical protein COLO4_33899 [Corchorus olitorius]|uniref:Uncharacterized protein n=1 Tax=Corchorus olitorius TaxID=93759 RepID=A0A1R3GQ73_9ROSI|nr:hypothetical protein COLO4_33899 [Corchorus olitorius]
MASRWEELMQYIIGRFKKLWCYIVRAIANGGSIAWSDDIKDEIDFGKGRYRVIQIYIGLTMLMKRTDESEIANGAVR